MSDKAIADFADTMMTRFPPFRQWEDYQEKAWADDLLVHLAGFSTEVIARAQREIIAKRKPNQPRPPMISECVDACVEAKRWIEAQKNDGRLPTMRAETSDFWSDERMRLAGELLRTPLGKQAAADNRALRFRDWVLKSGRAPESAAEIEQCKRDVRGFDQAYADCVAGRGGTLSEALAKLGASMLAKREKLRAEVLGR